MSISAKAPETETLRLARSYAAHSWSVVPVRPGDKLPAVEWARYQREPATDAQLTDWFGSGGYGIGLVQGAVANSIVLDFDGEEGLDTRTELERAHGPLPLTVEALTPGGGCHVILHHPGKYVPTRKRVLPGMDVRGDGGFIVAHPSRHANGRRYEWDIDHHPEDVGVAPCPAWVADLVCGEAPEGDSNSEPVVQVIRPGTLGMPETVIADGRETYMRDTVLAVLGELHEALGHLPTLEQLFEAAWGQYSRKVDFTRSGRGASEVRAKCRYTLARVHAGIVKLRPREPKTEPASNDKPEHDPETGEIIAFPATSLWDLSLDQIPPRRWLYGRELLRGFVSVLGSPGGVGKTGYTQVVGTSIALGRSLAAHDQKNPGQFQTVHKAGPVWFYNLEDPMDELARRMKAVLLRHGLNRSHFKHGLYIDSGRTRSLIITKRDERGNLVAHPVVADLVLELKRREIALLVVDPFVQSHTAEENRNEEMNLVMALWGRVAHEADCAVWLVHHFRKGGQAGDGDSFRGAGAIQGAARVMSTLSAMTTEEASKIGIQADARRQYVRLDSAKANMAPSAERAEWYRLVSVKIGNTQDPEYPEGDQVQTVEPWEPPSPWEGLGWATIARLLDRVQVGPSTGERYSSDRRSKDRWIVPVIVEMAGSTEGQAAAIVKAWIKNGVFEEGQYASPARKGAISGCITVNPTKAAEMRSVAQTGVSDDY